MTFSHRLQICSMVFDGFIFSPSFFSPVSFGFGAVLPAPSRRQIHVTASFPKCFANIGTIHLVLFL